MNKEEFKGLILKQFKEKGAAIHALMLESDTQHRDNQTYFKLACWFVCSEFETEIYVQRLIDEQGTVKFDVRFIDASGKDPSYWKKMLYCDLSSQPKKLQVHYKEVVEVHPQGLRFSLQAFTVSHEDYVYCINEGRPEFMLEYDMENNSFNALDPNVYPRIWEALRASDSGYKYIDFVPSGEFIQTMNSFVDSAPISLTRNGAIKYAVHSVRRGSVTSPMNQLVRDLMRIV